MRSVVIFVVMGVWLGGTTLVADTKTGTANAATIQAWSFTTSGPVNIVLSWKKSAADLDMILVCGTSDPQVVGIDTGVVDRLAIIQIDSLFGNCLLGVTSFRGVSPYRVHFREGVSLSSRGEGRISLVAPESMSMSPLHEEAERVLWKFQQVKAARELVD